jgi:hypothetical protein
MHDYTGSWVSTFGPMELTQSGTTVHGYYLIQEGVKCRVQGEVQGDRLEFTYREPNAAGEGWFELSADGSSFSGRWHPQESPQWGAWTGARVGYGGLWESSFGLLRLVEEDDHVHGFYEMAGVAEIDGRRSGDRLDFTFREPKAGGEGWFELGPDGLSFAGQWRPDGGGAWQPWQGRRMLPQAGMAWLVVLETPWQRFLMDKEYAFGDMLHEFFSRTPQVQVRHRFFINEAGLKRCCRELMYLPDPVVLVVASHALPEGIAVDGQVVSVDAITECLGGGGDLKLLHFSACLVMKDPAVVGRLQEFSRQSGAVVSGYATSVDWAASAIIEFTYLEMILSKGLTPTQAAGQVLRLLPFAGDETLAGSPFPPAGFRAVLPGQTAN